jgi:hypothetical protein
MNISCGGFTFEVSGVPECMSELSRASATCTTTIGQVVACGPELVASPCTLGGDNCAAMRSCL